MIINANSYGIAVYETAEDFNINVIKEKIFEAFVKKMHEEVDLIATELKQSDKHISYSIEDDGDKVYVSAYMKIGIGVEEV